MGQILIYEIYSQSYQPIMYALQFTKYKVLLFESVQLRFSTFPASLTSQLAVQTVEGGLLLAIQALKEGA